MLGAPLKHGNGSLEADTHSRNVSG